MPWRRKPKSHPADDFWKFRIAINYYYYPNIIYYMAITVFENASVR